MRSLSKIESAANGSFCWRISVHMKEIKNFETNSEECPNQGLSNGDIFRRFYYGQKVPFYHFLVGIAQKLEAGTSFHVVLSRMYIYRKEGGLVRGNQHEKRDEVREEDRE